MIRVQSEPFDPAQELDAFAHDNDHIGAIANFIGKVRINSTGPRLISLTLEHYPGMTERKLTEIETAARARWPLADTLIIHRYGRLLPGDAIVMVATASSHRDAAFDSCRFLIDWLKTDAPFWKYEETATGGAWVAAREGDGAARIRWTEDKTHQE